MERLLVDYMKFKSEIESSNLGCQCGWSGSVLEAYNELYEDVVDLVCPICDRTLIIVNMVIDQNKSSKTSR